jgi:hypothetical protein
MQLAPDQANAAGGVQGQALRLISLDDELKPDKAVADYIGALRVAADTSRRVCTPPSAASTRAWRA